MKLLRVVVVVVLVPVAVVAAWYYLPGLRTRAGAAYDKYGGWTAEARQADPVGFIEYAESRLTDDLHTFADTQRALDEASERVSAELDRNRSLLTSANELAEMFRDAYLQTEAGSSWPVEVEGASYSRGELREQIRLTLTQRENYGTIIRDLDEAAAAAKEKGEELVVHIAGTKAALAQLPAKKEIARVNELTAGTQQLLDQVNELMEQNDQVLTGTSIRTVEELVQGNAKPSATPSVDVDSYLEGGE